MPAYIPAIVIQKNNTVFIGADGVSVEKSGSGEIMKGLGLATQVMTPDGGGVIDSDYWAIPVNDNGIISGFTYEPYNLNDPATNVAPTAQAFAVVRIINRPGFDEGDWYIVGTSAQYITASGGGQALPTTISTLLAGCQTLCNVNSDGDYIGVWGLPTLTGNKRYFPYGDFNNVDLPAASSSGYTTTGTLLTFLNTAVTGWAAVGTWSITSDTLIVTQTDGPGTDVVCIAVAAIDPSL